VGTIYPTHKCFDDALDVVARWAREHVELSTVTVVHAICLAPEGPEAGTPFAHAWVERDGRVWQLGRIDDAIVLWAADAAEYRAAMRPITEARYTVVEALAENRRSGTYGPWRPEIKALCGTGRRIFHP
jgi:hypothetical protein